jgi:sec-independent protein translocase protein TatB
VFNVGGGEILIIVLIALIFLGPDRMPDAAKKLGRFLGEARRMTSGFQEEIRNAMDLDGSDDAVHRSEPGPRLLGPPAVTPAPSETPPTESTPPATGDTTAPSPADEGRSDDSAA